MASRRFVYLAALSGLLVFYLAYREWVAWLILVAAVFLPLLSLLLSLPAMLTARLALSCPERITLGQTVQPQLHIRCKLPAPPVGCRLKLRHSITGEQTVWKQGQPLQARHCGRLELLRGRTWVYDYLGLWRLPVRRQRLQGLLVLPLPIPGKLPDPQQYLTAAWRPKTEGFAEQHELRLYRPGDPLRLIHWKLSAKTGKLISREPVEPVRKPVSLALVLSGTPEQIDEKLGRLLWLCSRLTEQSVPCRVQCVTGRGTYRYFVTDEDTLERMLADILASPPVKGQPEPDGQMGGERHEA